MVLLLDDDHLESLECTKCHKYLSVFPVKNHVTRDVTCGRCSTEDDGGVRSVLYELIAKKYVFRCVNRYEGCKELLSTDETQAHEKKCLGNVFGCPKCRDSTDMSVPELIWHYRVQHPSSYSKENTFVARPTGDDAVLHIRDDVVFFVLMRYEPDSATLRCCAVTLTDAEATQSVVVGAGSRSVKTEKRPCKTMTTFDGDYYVIDVDAAGPVEVLFDLKVSVGARPRRAPAPGTGDGGEEELKEEGSDQEESEEESVKLGGMSAVIVSKRKFKIQLPKDFKRRFRYELNEKGTALLHEDGHEVDLTCLNCKELIGLPLFRCTGYDQHQMCQNCHMICSACEMPCKQSDSDVEISSCFKYPCRWNCGKYFTSGLRNHENSCDLRKMKCPKCSAKVGLKFMRIHLSKEHDIVEFHTSYNAEWVKKYLYKFFPVYFMLHNTFYYLERITRQTVNWILCPLVDAPRAELKLIYKDPNNQNIRFVPDTKGISIENLHLYTPYLIFNHE